MAIRRINAEATPGWSVYAIVVRLSDGKVFDWHDNTWQTKAAVVTPAVAMTSLITVGGVTQFAANLDMATINDTTTPVEVVVMSLHKAGAVPDLDADAAIGQADAFGIIAGDVFVSGAANGYRIVGVINLTTTAGTNSHVKVQLVDAAGALLELDDIDPDATCTVDVFRDGVHAQFTLDTDAMGEPNANGWFEADFANPNYTTDIGYTGKAVIVSGGITYGPTPINFEVWP